MPSDMILVGEGALYIQPDGPNTEPQYLGCHTLGDVTAPKGDVTLVFCPDPSQPNQWSVIGSYQGAPGPVTTSIETLMKSTADFLESVNCPVPLYALKKTCGKKDQFPGWDRAFILPNSIITQETLPELVSRIPDDQKEQLQSFDISALKLIRAYRLNALRQGTSETGNLNDISGCNSERCAGDCGQSQGLGEDLFTAGSAVYPATANVDFTIDGGGLWTAGGADPFAANVDIAATACFYIGRDTLRRIVVIGTTDAGAPLKIAYSDDDGTTWTTVVVGSTNGQFGLDSGCIFALDMSHIWLVAGSGFIYFSEDGGASWTTQTAGTVTANLLHAVKFSDYNHGYAVGAANTILKTADGGTTWSLVAGPSAQAAVVINCVETLDKNRAWLGYDDGKQYYSKNGGSSWLQRHYPGEASASDIQEIVLLNDNVGLMITNNVDPEGTIWQTIDGGYTWEEVDTPTNAGLNACVLISPSLAFAVGNKEGSTAVILKIFAA